MDDGCAGGIVVFEGCEEGGRFGSVEPECECARRMQRLAVLKPGLRRILAVVVVVVVPRERDSNGRRRNMVSCVQSIARRKECYN